MIGKADMSHSFRTNDKKKGLAQSDLSFLEALIEKVADNLARNSCEPKVRDALRAIQLKQKFSNGSEAERLFWQQIEEIRREESQESGASGGLSDSRMEDRILDTIIGLKGQVKNGVLPVKTITDTFNQGRSEREQLTYHRVGRILSRMGFQKARVRNSSAILWDQEKIERMD
jgi:hypothetical protein